MERLYKVSGKRIFNFWRCLIYKVGLGAAQPNINLGNSTWILVLGVLASTLKVTTLRLKITTLRLKITTLRLKVTTLRLKVTTLRLKVTTLRLKITTLRLKVKTIAVNYEAKVRSHFTSTS
jgi:hypothetical protein